MNPEQLISQKVKEAIVSLYGVDPELSLIQTQATRKEFEGDITAVMFPLLKISKKSPEQTGEDIGNFIRTNCPDVENYNVVKGFLNIKLSWKYWFSVFSVIASTEDFGQQPESGKTVMVEFSSPNTNKPLHLGHIRNNLLGWSVAKVLEANGHNVLKVNLVNDRGIHICKSMIAWQKLANGESPDSSAIKGDHLVGKYYVAFNNILKKQIEEIKAKGVSEDEAEKSAPILKEAQEMLVKWENGDNDVVGLWKMMNSWVYAGFDKTYSRLGVSFEKTYYESETYLLGKALVGEGLKKGVFYQKEDGSVWCDLTPDGLDEKLLLRADGTSVYMTQDLGTAHQRFSEYNLNEHIYVVGNEQNYHFQVLKLLLKKLGFEWAENIYHLSYGMVELPEGKMKSREGTVVNFDFRKRKLVDIQNIFHKMEQRTLSAALKFYCNKELENAHSAEADTIATFEILEAQLDKYNDVLENDVKFLSEFSTKSKFVDYAGRIVLDEKDVPTINFGKHKGKAVENVFKSDPSYYSWMMNGEFTLDTKQVITELKIKFETPSQKPLI